MGDLSLSRAKDAGPARQLLLEYGRVLVLVSRWTYRAVTQRRMSQFVAVIKHYVDPHTRDDLWSEKLAA